MYNDPNATLDFTYDAEAAQERIDKEQEQETLEAAQAEAELKAQQEAETKVPVEPEEPETKSSGFLDGLAGLSGPSIEEQFTDGVATDLGGKQQVVAGTIDLAMDGISALIPAMQTPADWWDEKSGRKTETDPYKKAERDMGGMMVGTLLGGGVVGGLASKVPGAANLGMRTKFLGQAAADLGVDALLSGVSDATREVGNLGTVAENLLPNGMTVPWASRDSDSPDVVFAKNMTENMMLGTAGEMVGALFTFGAKNIFKPANESAAAMVAAKQVDEVEALAENGGDPLVAVVNRARAKKRAAQLNEGQRVLAEDPDGLNGYNAFVNEPAEPQARITLDEESSPIDFMADQARIQNNVGTFDGRARPLINDVEINALSQADAATRADILAKVEGDLGAEFSLTVGDKKLTKLDVAEAVNNLYDTALQPAESFADAVKSMRNAEVNLFEIVDQVADSGKQEIYRQTAARLIDAVSPYKQRASAAIQTQAASSVSDIGRNIDLMADVVDTSRLQELVMPRLRTLLKEAETSKVSERVASEMKAKFTKKTKDIEGLLEVDEEYLDNLMYDYMAAVEAKAAKVDAFVDELSTISKDNPNALRPLYRMWAKTNGDIDTLYKMNKYFDNRLGVVKKAFIDGNPEIPSVILRELQGVRMGNLLNGLAPAKAWIGNAAMLMIKPATIFAGSIPRSVGGNLKAFHRAWYQFSGGLEVFQRAKNMALDELRFANANPDAAMARGRADYNQSEMANPGGNDWRKSLAEFEEMEEMSETWDIGKQAIWNLTKTSANWNRKSWNRWGIHQMYSADGFVKSMMASANSRAKAFDELYQANNGVISKDQFRKVEQDLYNQTFDEQGVIRDGYAKYMSEEVALNADVALTQSFGKVMDNIPILKSIFMFPKTRLNQFSLVQTFDPTGILGGYIGKVGKTLRAKTPEEIQDVLDMHGMKGGTTEDFLSLKSEYYGRKMMTGSVVMTAALAAIQGRLVGKGPSDPAENKKWRDLGGQPYSYNLGTAEEPNYISYEAAPAWIKSFLGLTADVTREFTAADGDIAENWYRTIADSLSANVTNDLFGSEIETLNGLLNNNGRGFERYMSNMIDSMLPGAGVRSTLSSTLVPNLQDVENNLAGHLANRNRWIPNVEAALADQTDIFTGEPIGKGSSPLEVVASKLLPGFKTKAGVEPWREWLLSTGWKGLSDQQKDRLTGEKLTPPVRQWIDGWIGDNLELDKKVIELMEWDDGKWDKALKKYKKKRGLRSQADLPVKELFIHEYMDDMINDAYKQAWDAYAAMNEQLADINPLMGARSRALSEGKIGQAVDLADQIKAIKQLTNPQ